MFISSLFLSKSVVILAVCGSGDVKTTLSEIASLPEAGQAAMAEWVTQAEARLSALDALDALLAAQSE